MAFTQAEIDNLFVYHAPQGDQAKRYEQLRASAKVFAEKIVALTPASADQSAAIRHVREAVFTANAAIACSPLTALPPLLDDLPSTDKAPAPEARPLDSRE